MGKVKLIGLTQPESVKLPIGHVEPVSKLRCAGY
jgi:hypothetical protein